MNKEYTSMIKDMATLVTMGAKEIMAEHGVNEETAILTSFKYTCEWLTENKPELTTHWLNLIKAGA